MNMPDEDPLSVLPEMAWQALGRAHRQGRGMYSLAPTPSLQATQRQVGQNPALVRPAGR